jgi:hypothetical protein
MGSNLVNEEGGNSAWNLIKDHTIIAHGVRRCVIDVNLRSQKKRVQ